MSNKKTALDFYKSHLGKTVINKEKGISISIKSAGLKKTIYTGTISKNKLICIKNLPFILQNAKYTNWGEPKPLHIKKYNAIGFLNFTYSFVIDRTMIKGRINVMVTKNGKFHYFINELVNKNKAPN